MAGPPRKRPNGGVNDNEKARAYREKQLSDLQDKQREEWLQLVLKHQQEQNALWSRNKDESVFSGVSAIPSQSQALPSPSPSTLTFNQAQKNPRSAPTTLGISNIEYVDLTSDDETPAIPATSGHFERTSATPTIPFYSRGTFSTPLPGKQMQTTERDSSPEVPLIQLRSQRLGLSATPKAPPRSCGPISTPSPGKKQKRTIDPDSSPEVPLSQLRSQQLDHSSIKRPPTPIPRDAALRVLQASKKNGIFITEILHNGRSQSWHPELEHVFQRRIEDRDGDVNMEEAIGLPQAVRRSLVVKVKMPIEALQKALGNHKPNDIARGIETREQSILDMALRGPPPCPIDTWTAGDDKPTATKANQTGPFKIPALPRASQTPCPPGAVAEQQRMTRQNSVTRKRARHIVLSEDDDDSDFELESSPCPSSRAQKDGGKPKGIASTSTSSPSRPQCKTTNNTSSFRLATQPPPAPCTPPSKRIKLSTPSAPRKPRPSSVRPTATIPLPPFHRATATASTPQNFRSASTSLHNKRQKRAAQLIRENRTRNILEYEEAVRSKSARDKRQKRLEAQQVEVESEEEHADDDGDGDASDKMKEVGGRMRRMSLTPGTSLPQVDGAAGDRKGKKTNGNGYDDWVNSRMKGDRYTARSVSIAGGGEFDGEE
ncbi:hypothetical protein K491DRAFT_79113 [Lophiostoma macrostomum CBS 122681]|uniref:Uncharacterized protein n=1 Tax=Lophiostoma macrostomum CBS 122681 TaxID=1314788 RepID=A0A6A6TN71_9PLEO|nr:hypothetical protein K491DRAFT_79113 [Lophiostoma macrostomum CBS 122681]